MAIDRGSCFGPYVVAGTLGAGAMGEVYRATDTTLERDVAIKVLPASFVNDAGRVARFEREAKMLAALNHPNVAQIYGVERSGGVTALAMELVEGETLAERLARGALAPAEALDVALQIAAALEAAHGRGIVHRDLKPGNVKLRPDGIVKVLDFGIAKTVERASADGSDERHATPDLTEVGSILGTAQYMSPEQARGRPLDQRSDIWAFGCVLYEMLTGQPAFGGEDSTVTLARIIEREPDLSALPAGVTPSMRRAIAACLAKDRRVRLADIRDVRLLLEGGLDVAVDRVAGGADARAGLPWPIAAAAAVITLLLGGLLAMRFPLQPAVEPERAVFRLHAGLTAEYPIDTTIGGPALAVSADGRRLVYRALVDNRIQLVQRRLDEWNSSVLYSGASIYPTFAPDGTAVAFLDPNAGQIMRVAVDGGQARPVPATPVTQTDSFAWLGDDTIVLWESDPRGLAGLWRVPADGGTAGQLTTPDAARGELAHGYPTALPGGRGVLFSVRRNADGGDVWQLAALDLAAGSWQPLGINGRRATYIESGHIVYGDGATLWAAPFDVDALALAGPPVPVLDGVAVNTDATQFALTAEGSLYFLPAQDSVVARGTLLISDESGVVVTVELGEGTFEQPRVSPDGARLAVARDQGEGLQIWIYDLAGSVAPRRLTFEGTNRAPVWSADGQRLAFQSDRGGDRSIFEQRADGTGAAERLTTAADGEAHVPDDWSPDGETLLFEVIDQSLARPEESFSLWLWSAADRGATRFADVSSVQSLQASFSPDGRWVAYAYSDVRGGTRSARRGIYVQPYPPTGARYQTPAAEIDFHPAWSRDGAELLYAPSAARPLVAVPVTLEAGIAFGASRVLNDVPLSRKVSNEPRGYDVGPDGRIFVLSDAVQTGAAPLEIDVVLNWAEEVRRLVPVE